MERAVCETEPQRPSLALTRSAVGRRGGGTTRVTPEAVGRARGTDVKQLKRKLSGDLGAIVMRALR